jgi:hypothetical protein
MSCWQSARNAERFVQDGGRGCPPFLCRRADNCPDCCGRKSFWKGRFQEGVSDACTSTTEQFVLAKSGLLTPQQLPVCFPVLHRENDGL